jgi:hypothetical protein
LLDAGGVNGFRLNGPTANAYAGLAVAAGDVTGDGRAEVVVGAPRHGGGPWYGRAYVVFGKAGAWGASSTTLNAAFLQGSGGGFTLTGGTARDGLGLGLAVADLDGDGTGDLVLGASGERWGAVPARAGVYVVHGKSSGWNAGSVTDGTLIDGSQGFYVQGVDPTDELGVSLAAGDVDNNGRPDLVIGVARADYTANNAGSTYVLFNSGDWDNPTLLSDVDP